MHIGIEFLFESLITFRVSVDHKKNVLLLKKSFQYLIDNSFPLNKEFSDYTYFRNHFMHARLKFSQHSIMLNKSTKNYLMINIAKIVLLIK